MDFQIKTLFIKLNNKFNKIAIIWLADYEMKDVIILNSKPF